LIAILSVLVVVLAACGEDKRPDESRAGEQLARGSTVPARVVSPGLPDLGSYLGQQIEWTTCPEQIDAECGAINIPVDYARPEDSAISMPVVRLPAADPSARLGVLTFPPGGPGSSGYDYVLGADDDPALSRLRERYDFVGWDPRGFGRTAAIHCLSDEAMDDYQSTDFTPTDDAGVARVIAAQHTFADGCQRNAGPLLGQVGVEVVVKDIDVLRAALGEERLNFLGISYGTSIAQHYAQQFPERVGRMVLDSVDDPATDGGVDSYDDEDSWDTPGSDPDPGFSSEMDDADKVVANILSSCAAAPDCPLGQDPDAAQAALGELIQAVMDNPIPLPDGRKLGITMLLDAAFQATYAQEEWSVLTQGIAEARDGDGTKLATLADYFNGRDEEGHYNHKRDYFWSVLCLAGDPATYRKRSDQEIAAHLTRAAAKAGARSPLFGTYDVYNKSVCSFWSVPPTVAPAPIVLDNVPPILLVNNTGDPATPVADAQRVADSLTNSVLVLSERDDHDAFGHGSQCIDDIVVTYLFDGTMPPPGTRCSS
jgi:pimeloyl-ACP methyl ester carboxylesterase